MRRFDRGRWALSRGNAQRPARAPSYPDHPLYAAESPFFASLRSDFNQCGPEFFAQLRHDHPGVYARLVMTFADALRPPADPLAGLEVAEIDAMLEYVRQRIAELQSAAPGGPTAAAPEAADGAR
jgi:hypothetical protein